MRSFKTCLLALTILIAGSPDSNASPLEETPQTWFEEGKATILKAAQRKPNTRKARNVILFVGDGMSISTVTAARIRAGQKQGRPGEENALFFETLPYTAFSKTYNTNQQTPDSAGTMTAMVTGVKTKAGFISINQDAVRGDSASSLGKELFTILEKAEIAGKSTGIVSTAKITHATPAACYAHVPERGWESDDRMPKVSAVKDIAAQLIDFPKDWAERGFAKLDGPEVVLGGGRSHFFPQGEIPTAFTAEGDSGSRRDGRNLAQEWIDSRKNSAYIHNLDSFNAIDASKTDHLLGLFNPSHLEFEADRASDKGGEPSLAEMTKLSIDILEKNNRGYFLMVEGGRIDHAHHASNAYRALEDTIAFDEAIKTAYENTDPKDTLIIVTADHSHVFTIAGYPTRGNPILGLVAGNNTKGEPKNEFQRDALGKPYTTLGYTNGPGYLGKSDQQPEGVKTFPHSYKTMNANTSGRPDLATYYELESCSDDMVVFNNHLQESAVPLPSETHAGEDVGIWATGPYAHLLSGTVEQNVIFHLMDYAMKLKVEDPFLR